MHTALGDFSLQRLPLRKKELLRAWDAADEYLLNYLNEHKILNAEHRILIMNDGFGALATALNHYQPCALSDSYLSQEATRINLQTNGIKSNDISLFNSLVELQGNFDLVLIKATKSLALLEDELIRLRTHISPNTQIIIAGMIKGLPPRTWKLLEKYIGPTTTSLAQKKARLIFVTPNPDLTFVKSPYPTCYELEGTNHQICNHANVFSRESLDIGTRLFLQHIPESPGHLEIIDLGCGNGVVGLIAAEKNPHSSIHFVDESHMAVASAKENYLRAFKTEDSATFNVGDGLNQFDPNSADIILCNPPFHQQSTVGVHLAQRMFIDSKRVLKSSGQLWIVGNRHLGYHKTLQKIFNHVELIDSNKKFVILMASDEPITI